MTTPSDDRQQVEQWLDERGYTPEQIEKIQRQLKQYDARVVRESLFDSIGTDSLDVDAIIKQAIGDLESSEGDSLEGVDRP